MLPVEYFERTPAGMTTYKMAQISRIRAFLVGQLFGTVLDSGILLFFVPVMFFFSPVLTAVVLAIATLICLIIILMLPQYRRYTGAVETIEAERGAFLGQTIHGIRTVKSLSLESRQAREWDRLTARVARAKFAEGNYAALLQALVMPLERLMIWGSFALGVYLALTTADPTAHEFALRLPAAQPAPRGAAHPGLPAHPAVRRGSRGCRNRGLPRQSASPKRAALATASATRSEATSSSPRCCSPTRGR